MSTNPPIGSRPTTDSISNFAARLGVGPGIDNVASGSTYTLNPITRNRMLCDSMFRGSWLARQGVQAIPEDMTRAGILINSSLPAGDSALVLRDFVTLQIWQQINSTMKWARLYGGCIGFLMIEGQDPSTPLRLDTIGRGQFKGVYPLDRWMINPTLSDLVTDYGPDFGTPRFYNTNAQSILPAMTIHHTRALRFDGADIPFWQRLSENMWGLSVLEPFYDRLVAFDSTTQGAAQLVYKAHLRTVYIDELREAIAAGADQMENIAAQMNMIRKYQSIEGLTLLDSKDRMEVSTYSFSGLDLVLIQFAQQLAGALQIPLVRLFGQSPAGLNATGDADIRLYYDAIATRQTDEMRSPVSTLLQLVFRSRYNAPPPEDLDFDFVSLWQMNPSERAQVAATVTDTTIKALDAGLITVPAAMEELRMLAQETGQFSNITDEMIAEAEATPPDVGETLPPVPEMTEIERVDPEGGNVIQMPGLSA